MPNRDGTGPEGRGPKTGRQMGNCERAKPTGSDLGPYGRKIRRGLGRRFANDSPNNED